MARIGDRYFGICLIAVAFFWIARGAGIPAWTDWTPGDATDIGFFVMLGLFWLCIGRPNPSQEPSHEE